MRLGVVGAGRIADRFLAESRHVSGVEVGAVFSRTAESAEAFRARHGLSLAAGSYAELLDASDVVYIATPHETHVELAHAAIARGRHVLVEKPAALSRKDCSELFGHAAEKHVVLLETIKTAFCPGFGELVEVARSGVIGEIRSVDATFTRLTPPGVREMRPPYGGAITELGSYPLLAIVKLLGHDPAEITAHSWSSPEGVDLFSRIDLLFDDAVASARVGLGVKAEGALVVAGTKGYVYVPAPWWKTGSFEVRFEDPDANRTYVNEFEGDGLRYALAELLALTGERRLESTRLTARDSVFIAGAIAEARCKAVPFG